MRASFAANLGLGEGGICRETEAVQRRADPRDIEASRGGVPVPELIRRVGISEQTFYRWKKLYVGLEIDQVRQLKQLQEENQRLKRLVVDLVRYGYRKILVLLQREGWAVGKTMVSRLYREEGLALRRTVPRKRRVAVERRERLKATGPNQVWSLDFVTDQLVDGRRFRALTVMDVHTRESLAIEPGQSLRGKTWCGCCRAFRRIGVGRSGCSVTTGRSFPVRCWTCGPIRTE